MADNKVNLISPDTKLEGKIEFKEYTRFDGHLSGTLIGHQGCELIIGENGVVEGKIEADILIIDGFVRGEINAKSKLLITGSGRVIGDICSSNFSIEFGGYFEGNCQYSGIIPETT